LASDKKAFIGKAIGKKLLKLAIPVFVILVLFLVGTINQKKNREEIREQNRGSQNPTETLQPNADQFVDRLVAENEKYALYLDGPTLSVTIRDKETGAVLESSVKEEKEGENTNQKWKGFIRSGIVLDVIKGENDAGMADLINAANQIAIETIENGFHAYVSFLDYGFRFELYVRLEGDRMTVEIPDASILETLPGTYIGAINVFPFLGYSHLGDEKGYMLIPDGNGALIYLDDKEGRVTGGYSRMIYGEDTGFRDSSTESLLWGELQTVNEEENIMAPVFGMVHTEDEIGFLGIVEGGKERASIEAYPNGVTLNYNRIYPKFILRKLYNQPTSQSDARTIKTVERDRTHYDIRVHYCLVSGQDADYTGLAVRYRGYLLEDAGVERKDNGYHTRLDFLGTEREEWLVFKKKVTMTTAEDIRGIYSDLEAEGVRDILSLYKGWQSGGLYQVPVKKYKADGALGKTSELTKLIREAGEQGQQLYLYQDVLRINPDENNTTFNVVKRVDKRLFQEYAYKEVYNTFLYLTPSRSGYYVNGLAGDLRKKGVPQLAVAGITNKLFSYSYSGNYYYRPDTLREYEKIISRLGDEFNLALEQPFSYLWKYTDVFLDMPVGSSNYNFTDEEVPFLTIALKGLLPMYSEYMNFQANKQEFFLKLVETGVCPSFYITKEDSSALIYTNSDDIYSSKYSTYRSEILRYARELGSVYETVKGAFIISHERLGNGVTVVRYDNGTNIYVNYSEEDRTVDGYTVKAMSYKAGEADE
jgi:hypothetical protein